MFKMPGGRERGGGKKCATDCGSLFKNLTVDLGNEIPPFIISCNQPRRCQLYLLSGIIFDTETGSKRGL